MKNAITDAAKEEISQKEDEIFEERQSLLEETVDNFEDMGGPASGDMIASINEAISELGEDELEELELESDSPDILLTSSVTSAVLETWNSTGRSITA